ncbi:alpha/beta hydrolase [Leucobacter sp. gxy201]|uniref:alpha/beta hydrolase n=1 Tax=Leucobacter sp. gxy201 TaxID=2957200 RepID=UPI003DA1730D
MGVSAAAAESRRMRTVGVVVATVLMIGVGACAPAADPVLEPRAHGAAWQAESFASVYEQRVEWRECDADDGLDADLTESLEASGVEPDGIACGAVTAPFDWNDPENEQTIELAVVRVLATGEPRGTLIGNPGGPGATGIDFMLGMAAAPGFDQVLEHYDLLGFDPRGIGSSTPIDCDAGVSELPEIQLGECIAEHPLTRTMGTVQVARDMELLRALQGAEKLDYLGYSYGTMLGATYASIFPERVGRMVLDSAENAEWASPIHSFEQQVAIAKAVVALATDCRTEYADEVEVCPFDSEASVLAVLERLQTEPLVASDGTEITGADLYGYLTGALYSSHYGRGIVLDTVALALFGDQEAIDALGAEVSGGSADLAMRVVSCHSFPIEPDIPGLLAHVERVGVPRLMGGPEITDEVLAPFVDLSCYALPESGLDVTESFDAAGAGPILVIGITGDHATPYPYAQELVDELGPATLLTLDGQGHAASFSDRSSCIDAAVTAYLVAGEMPATGTVCTDD